MLFAFFMAVIGSLAGFVSGWQFLKHINQIEDWLFNHFGFQLWDRSIYAIGDIPNTLNPDVIVIIFVCAVIACLLGASIPSWQAAKQKPIETLQVNQL